MRRAPKLDANQTAIVGALRSLGYRVQSLAAVGGGVPDLLVSTPLGTLVLLEVKDGSKAPSAQRLTGPQESFHRHWSRCPLFVVRSPEEALALLKDI